MFGSVPSLGAWDRPIKLAPNDTYTVWRTFPAVVIPRGAMISYKFARLLPDRSLVWEPVEQPRQVNVTSKAITIDDTFGSMDDEDVSPPDDMEQSESEDLTPAAEALPRSSDAESSAQHLAALAKRLGNALSPEILLKEGIITERMVYHDVTPALIAEMMRKRRMFCVTLSLPVLVRRVTDDETGAVDWSVEFDQDNFLAKGTKHSLADHVKLVWVGLLTRDCVDRVAPTERPRSESVPGSPVASTTGSPLLVPKRTQLLDHFMPLGDGCSPPDDFQLDCDVPPSTTESTDSVGKLDLELVNSIDEEPSIPNNMMPFSAEDRAILRAKLAEIDCIPIFLEDVATYSEVVLEREASQRKADTAAGAVPHGSFKDDDEGDAVEREDEEREGAEREDFVNGSRRASFDLSPSRLAQAFPARSGQGEVELSAAQTEAALCLVRQCTAFLTMVLGPVLHNVTENGDLPSLLSLHPHDAPRHSSEHASSPNEEAARVREAGFGRLHIDVVTAINRKCWKAYRIVNEVFACVLAEQSKSGDVVWAHDYALCLLPAHLHKLCPTPPSVILFLHAPFPTSEVFRTLSRREEIIRGILAANVVGFHTFNHARHFLQVCRRVLGLSLSARDGGHVGLDVAGRDVTLTISHVGVDPETLDDLMESHEAAAYARAFREKFPGKLIVAGMDTAGRLQGVVLQLLAFERLLEMSSLLSSKVILILCVERQGFSLHPDICATLDEVHQLVWRINKSFGPVVQYLEAVSFGSAFRVGLFHVADVLMQIPVREGLNLMPLEYVYVRTRWELQRTRELARETPAVPAVASEEDAATMAHQTSNMIGEMPLHYANVAFPDSARAAAMAEEHDEDASGQQARQHSEESKMSGSDSMPQLGSAFDDDWPADSAYMDDLPPTPRRDKPSRDVSRNKSAAEVEVPSIDPRTLVAPLPPPSRGGCVILSEFSTASSVLNSTVRVNPFSIGEIAEELSFCLAMDESERAQRQWRDYHYSKRNPSWRWSRRVLSELLQSELIAKRGTQTYTDMELSTTSNTGFTKTTMIGVEGKGGNSSRLDVEAATKAFVECSRKILFVDYGGTLIAREGAGMYVKHEFLGHSQHSKTLPASVLEDIVTLTSDPSTSVIILIGLNISEVDARNLAEIPNLTIVAENSSVISWGERDATVLAPFVETVPVGEEGIAVAIDPAVFRRKDGRRRKWVRLVESKSKLTGEAGARWKRFQDIAKAKMEEYRWSVNGSRVRTAGAMVAWDFANSDPDWGQSQALRLISELSGLLDLSSVIVERRRAMVEVAPCGTSKATLMGHILEQLKLSGEQLFVLAVGDDSSDEEMFIRAQSILIPPPTEDVTSPKSDGSSPGIAPAAAKPLAEGRNHRLYTVFVRRKYTAARYILGNVHEVRMFLSRLASEVPPPPAASVE
jgi:trehalose-phosphatase